jgi:alpha 1,2-mannosyltransferase
MRVADNAIFRILGRTCSDAEWPAEAGEVVFDKRGNNGLNLAVLHLAHHMMAETWMYEFLSYGDKDTFVSRLRLCASPWLMFSL